MALDVSRDRPGQPDIREDHVPHVLPPNLGCDGTTSLLPKLAHAFVPGECDNAVASAETGPCICTDRNTVQIGGYYR